jgi:predicted XRE-type DNA-binding protein
MKAKATPSSGNVFADLGLPNPEKLLDKADIVIQIVQIIKRRKLTQAQAAKLLGIDQPQVSALMRGRFYRFSLERLLKFMDALGKRIRYSFEDKDEPVRSPHSSSSRVRYAASGLVT